jgi:hypothetical protein
MKRIGVALWIGAGLVVGHLGWTCLQRQAATRRMERRIEARRHSTPALRASSSSVRITQFYATSGEITDAEHGTICYGVENASGVRLEPPVASVTPSLTRCFWVEPKRDTTYRLIADGRDGSQASASFQLRVKPAPPSILFMAVSTREIVKGDAVTVCYGVDHATSVRLDPIHWALAATKQNCARFYPPASSNYTLIASGAAGATDSDRFSVRVR